MGINTSGDRDSNHILFRYVHDLAMDSDGGGGGLMKLARYERKRDQLEEYLAENPGMSGCLRKRLEDQLAALVVKIAALKK